MAWVGLTLTVDGRYALNNAQNNKTINFKAIVVGDGNTPANFNTRRELVNQLFEITELTVEVTDDGCTILGDFPTVDYDYYFREVGIIVTTPEGDKLYVYDNCGSDAQYIVVSTGVESTKKRIGLSLTISSVDTITVSTPSILYVTYDAFEEHTRATNPHNVTKEQVGLGNVENKNGATILSEMTKDNVVKALGYTPGAESTRRTITLTASGWSASYPYAQTVSVPGITADDNIKIIGVNIPDGSTIDQVKAINKAAGFLMHSPGGIGADSVTFKAYKKPAVDFAIITEGG